MTEFLGTTGLVLNEPLLWERGRKGRSGFSLPRRDVARCEVAPELSGPTPDLPELSEVDMVRHYVRLEFLTHSVLGPILFVSHAPLLSGVPFRYPPSIHTRYSVRSLRI